MTTNRSGRPKSGDVRLPGPVVPAEDAEALAQAAAEDGTTVPEQQRRAIRHYLAARARRKKREQ